MIDNLLSTLRIKYKSIILQYSSVINKELINIEKKKNSVQIQAV